MTLEQLSQLNEKFQQKSTELAELLPGSNLLTISTRLIRCAQKIEKLLHKVLAAKSTMSFYNQMGSLEEEMDELIFVIDRLDEANRENKLPQITDLVKKGYELLSLYSICCDQVIERKNKKVDEFE